MLGINYNHGIKETNEQKDLSKLSTSIVEAFRVYNIREDKKALKKAMSNTKKSSLKQRI